MSENTIKILIAILSIALGWLLAQGTELIKTFLRERKIKKALFIELTDIRDDIGNLKTYYFNLLAEYGCGRVAGGKPVPLSNRIFKNHFDEIAIKLNQTQRRAYEIVHAFIDTINAETDVTRELKDEYVNQPNQLNLDYWGTQIINQFVNCELLIFNIDQILKSPKNPVLHGDDEIGKRSAQIRRLAEQKALEIVKTAKHSELASKIKDKSEGSDKKIHS